MADEAKVYGPGHKKPWHVLYHERAGAKPQFLDGFDSKEDAEKYAEQYQASCSGPMFCTVEKKADKK